MASPDLWKILIACIGFGFGAEAVRRYRAFKTRRWEQPAQQRNAGFWTDRRLYRAEAAFCALSLGAPFTGIILAVWTNQRFETAYLAVVAYPLAIYVLMSSLNMRETQ